MKIFLFFFFIPLSEGNVFDDINMLFWIGFGIFAFIGFVIRISNGVSTSRGYKKYSKPDIVHYLIRRFELAGQNRNFFNNDPLLAPMGFIDALNDEQKKMISQASLISDKFNLSQTNVLIYINQAYNDVYNKYIE